MRVRIWDNGGETCDRYTVRLDSAVFTMSEDALSPQGVNMYCGDEMDESHFRADERRTMADVPAEVRKAIRRRMLD